MSSSSWSLYIVESRDGSLYTGITTDIRRRIEQHENGSGSKYLRGKGPLNLRLLYDCADRSSASKLECKIKRLSKVDKMALIIEPRRIKDCLE